MVHDVSLMSLSDLLDSVTLIASRIDEIYLTDAITYDQWKEYRSLRNELIEVHAELRVREADQCGLPPGTFYTYHAETDTYSISLPAGSKIPDELLGDTACHVHVRVKVAGFPDYATGG